MSDSIQEVKAGDKVAASEELIKKNEIKPENEAKAVEATSEVEAKPEDDAKPEGEAKAETAPEGEAKAVEATPKPEESDTEVKQSSGKKKKIIGGIFGGLAVALAATYVGVAIYYGSHFFPGTTINGIPCGNSDMSEVRAKWDAWAQDYHISVVGRDPKTREKTALAVLGAADFDWIEPLDESAAKVLMDGQNRWLWPQIFAGGSFAYNIEINADYDASKIKDFLEKVDAFKRVNMTPPTDATVRGYSDTDRRIVLEPEVAGTLLYMNRVYQAIGEAAGSGQIVVDIEDKGCYVEPKITVEDPALKRSIASANTWLQTSILYDWNGTEVLLDADQIKDWVALENGVFTLNEDAIGEYVANQAKEYDTYKKRRNFQTTLGYELDLPGGAFGWLTDKDAETEALINLIRCGAVGNREPEYEKTAPVKGADDIGDSYVEADLTHQHLYLYQQGEIVLETDFVSGNMSNGNKTPEGVFGLTYKTKNAILRGPNYASHVNYWMPFNGNVGMHDATWRNKFGGDIYKTGGSHGCINLPLSMAAEIYPYVSEGFPVICYYYPAEMLAEMELSGQLPGDQPGQEAAPVSADPAEGEIHEEPGAPTEGQPTEGQPVEEQPAEGQPTEGQPAEGQPTDGLPAEG